MSTDKTHLTIGFSPCPNDCFIFDAMVHHKIDTEGLSFDCIMDDVETLNKKALETALDVTKLSFATYALLTEKYTLLNAGSALGKGCGPLLIAKDNIEINPSTRIAIPGKYTTANFLLSLAYPEAKNKVELVFSEIENAVASGTVDAGLIIHENRFTYAEKGLLKLIDLGEFWEQKTHAPIPLGGIVSKKTLSPELTSKLNRILKKSVEYAFANPNESRAYVKKHAQEMSDSVIDQHINLYVNDFSIDLGKEGKRAIDILLNQPLP